MGRAMDWVWTSGIISPLRGFSLFLCQCKAKAESQSRCPSPPKRAVAVASRIGIPRVRSRDGTGDGRALDGRAGAADRPPSHPWMLPSPIFASICLLFVCSAWRRLRDSIPPPPGPKHPSKHPPPPKSHRPNSSASPARAPWILIHHPQLRPPIRRRGLSSPSCKVRHEAAAITRNLAAHRPHPGRSLPIPSARRVGDGPPPGLRSTPGHGS